MTWGLIVIGLAVIVALVGIPLPVAGGMRLAHFVTGSALASIGLALALDGPVLTVAIATQAFALFYVGARTSTPAYQSNSALLGGIVIFATLRGIALNAYLDHTEWAELATHALVAVLLVVAATMDRRPLVRSVTASAAFVIVVALPYEVATTHGWDPAVSTLWWTVLAVGLLLSALRMSQPTVAKAAALTIAAGVIKAVANDLLVSPAGPRIGLLFGVGAGLLVFSYYATRLWDLALPTGVPEAIEEPPEVIAQSIR